MFSRSLLLTGPRQLAWVRQELPTPGPAEVLVETTSGAISIGSELPHYRGDSRITLHTSYPVMTGYESVGRVVAVGDAVQGLRVGDRVLCFYGHRTHALVPAAKAIPIPDDVDDARALLAILSCDVEKGIRKVGPRPDEAVLVTGAGTIGLLVVWGLAARGHQQVDVVEPDAGRRALAVDLGARRTLTPEEAAASQGSYTVGFECSSRDAAFRLLQEQMLHDGRICILADGNLEPLSLAPGFHTKELSIIGSSDGWDYRAHARWYFDAARACAEPLTRLFEWHVDAVDLPETFERLATTEDRPIKVLVRYEGT